MFSLVDCHVPYIALLVFCLVTVHLKKLLTVTEHIPLSVDYDKYVEKDKNKNEIDWLVCFSVVADYR